MCETIVTTVERGGKLFCPACGGEAVLLLPDHPDADEGWAAVRNVAGTAWSGEENRPMECRSCEGAWVDSRPLTRPPKGVLLKPTARCKFTRRAYPH